MTSTLKSSQFFKKQLNTKNPWFRNQPGNKSIFFDQSTQYEKNPKGKIIIIKPKPKPKPPPPQYYNSSEGKEGEGEKKYIVKCENPICKTELVKTTNNVKYCRKCYLDSIGFQICSKCGHVKKKNKFEICYKCFDTLRKQISQKY